MENFKENYTVDTIDIFSELENINNENIIDLDSNNKFETIEFKYSPKKRNSFLS
jgi:hypothetical protein